MTNKIKIGVLISGGGSNLQAIIDAAQESDFPAEVVCVISNKENAGGLERAKKSGIARYTISHDGKSRDVFEADINKIFNEHKVDLVCLAGFMRILSANFINLRKNRILNIHPSLLPKYGGKGMYGRHVHEAVIESGDRESGASVHIVTVDCDQGPVILQKSVRVLGNDTAQDLAERVLQIEHEIYPLAVKKYAQEMLAKTV